MSRPARLDGCSYRGPYRYFLTICTRDRQQVFVQPNAATLVIDHLLRTARKRQFAVPVYCVMPDHAHVLVEGLSADSDLRRFAKRLKQGSGQAFSRRHGFPLWQEGYVDHVLRDEEQTLIIARYILENPVRAGLVQHPLDYPYSGSTVWTLEELIAGFV
jgi:REP element-mobilizing transposase RayT